MILRLFRDYLIAAPLKHFGAWRRRYGTFTDCAVDRLRLSQEVMMNIVFERHKELFRDEESYQKFVETFKQQARDGGMSAVFSGEEIIGTVLSPQASKDILYERLVQKIAAKPQLLDELTDRIQNDPVVE